MTRTQTTVAALILVLLVAASAFYVGRATTPSTSISTSVAGAQDDSRKVLYWHDPMVPGQRFDKPGKSPFMDMQLVPVYADDASESNGVKVAAGVRQNLGIRFATVRREQVASSFDAIGTVQFDERLNVAVQSRVAGYAERLSVRAPMERVRQGQPLATIFAPEWLGPLNELVALRRAGVSEDLITAARDRTRAMSIPPELVRQAESGVVPTGRYTITAPSSGVIAELGVREGVAVTPGTTLFRIAGLEKVWAVADIPEAQAIRLVPGQKVRAVLQADPSQNFDGTLTEILPEVSATTRTLKARFEVDNKAGKLTPGLLLRLAVGGATGEHLVVASEAVIRTGKRAVVIVQKEGGALEPRDVSTAAEFGDDIEITRGLAEGERVVSSGQFLIDSEANLRSAVGNMAMPSGTEPSSEMSSMPAVTKHAGQGKVERVTSDSITISHGPIPSMKWPAMTMGFAKPDTKAFNDIKAGDTVRFEFKESGASGYQLVSVLKVAPGVSK
jgi:Cu(I)/Ag(I) efflux system membrane fusion protein